MDNYNKAKQEVKGKAQEIYKAKASAAYNDREKTESMTTNVKDAAADLYDAGKRKISDLRERVSDHSDEVVHKVKEKPFTSLLIAGGICFIISLLLKK